VCGEPVSSGQLFALLLELNTGETVLFLHLEWSFVAAGTSAYFRISTGAHRHYGDCKNSEINITW
jgi:hypothetical protein